MKKRSILAGLALAAVAVLGLASCGEAETPSTETPTSETQAPSTPAAETLKVTFKVGTTTKEVSVKKGEKVTAPTDMDLGAGKVLDFWTEDGLTPFNFDNVITEATTLTAVVKDASEYDVMAASDKCIFAANGDMTITEGDKFTGTKGIYAATGDVEVTTSKEYKLTKNNMFVDFGGSKENGILTVLFDIQTAATNTEAFAILDGKSAAKTDNAEVIGIRDVKGALNYRFDGSSDNSLNKTIEANKKYTYKLVLDMAEGKLDIYRDGEKLADGVATTVTSIRGIKFTGKAAGTTAKIIDNVAVTFEEKAVSPIVAAKAAATKAIDDYLASAAYTGANAAVKALVDAQVTVSKAAIGAAETEAAVTTAATAWTTFANAAKRTVTVKAYTAASTATTATDYTVAVLDGGTIDATKAAFSGFNLVKVYTDEALTTEFASTTTITADTTLYAKVVSASEIKFDAAVALAALAKADAVDDGTAYGDFTVVGTSSKRSNSDTFSLQLNKNATGTLQFTVPTGKTANVTLKVSSTGGSDTSADSGLYTTTANDAGALVAGSIVTNNESVTTLTGTTVVTLTYTDLAAGTYAIGTKDTAKGIRVYEVIVSIA